MRTVLSIACLLIWTVAYGGPVEARDDDPAVRAALASEDWEERIKGLDLLAERKGDLKAVRSALPLLEDVDYEVRIHAARTLGVLGTDPARNALLDTAVKGEIAWLREAAVEALGSFDLAK